MNIPDRPPEPVHPADALVHRGAIDGVAVLSLAAPTGNRLELPVLAALSLALDEASIDPTIVGVVIAAEGPDFCIGPADDLPAPSPDQSPAPDSVTALAALCLAIEAAPKPVVAALQGLVASGGLALSLACMARVGAADTRLALPEGRLALVPPGNAAIRLAWCAGAGTALQLIEGATLTASEALDAGLLTKVTPEAPLAEAVALARTRIPRTAPGLADPAAFRSALVAARAALPASLPRHRGVEGWTLDCVEAAQLLPPDQALAFDLSLATEAARRPEARALTHLARARRRALGEPAAPPDRPVLAALGPAHAARLVPPLLRAGHQVILHAKDRETLTEALGCVAESHLAQVRAGQLTEAQAQADWQRIAGRLIPEAGSGAGLADDDHAEWLATAAPHATPLVVWTDATRYQIAAAALPRALLAVPAPTRPPLLCELSIPSGTDPTDVATGLGLVRALGLLPLRTAGGSVLTSMIRTAARAAARLRAAGVPAQTLITSGILPPGLAEGASNADLTALPLPPDRLLLLALINQGARLLAEGVARRPSDIDLAMVLAAGWPDWQGGPMAQADRIGPLVLRHEMHQAQSLDPNLWEPAALLSEMIQHGWRFETLNTA